MIINNSPLGLSKSTDACDCANSEYSQIVAIVDSPEWQISTQCNELTGGLEKLPCESNMIGPYTTDFIRTDATFVPAPITDEVLFGTESIEFISFQDASNLFATPAGFLTPNKCYNLRYTISGYTDGFIQTVVGSGTAQGPNARTADGTYEEIYCTDADGRLIFQVGNDDTPTELNNLTLSNIFLNCIRYSQLYDITALGVDQESETTFTGQTSICKTGDNSDGTQITLSEDSQFFVGQTYGLCFSISNTRAGDVTLIFFNGGPTTYSGNGRVCVEESYIGGGLTFELSDDFQGCIHDITIYLVPEIRAELFDSNGEIVEDGLTKEPIGDTLKLSLNPNIEHGCYRVGVSDSCSNFLNQFYGNILEKEFYSYRLLNVGVYPITKSGNTFSLDYSDFADYPNGEIMYLHYFVIKNSICNEKVYDGEFVFTINDGGNSFQRVRAYVYPAGTSYIQQETSPGATVTLTFDDMIAGTVEQDDCSNLVPSNPDLLCELAGKNALIVIIQTVINKVGSTPPLVQFSTNDSFVAMDQETPQFCPEYYSVPLNIVSGAPCDSILIKYRNDNDAFGIDYTSPGYTESDGFYNKLRILGKVWKSGYERTTEAARNSTGLRTKYYADVSKNYTLTTELLPEFIHDALALAIEHRTLIIEDREFISSGDAYDPEWDKSSTLASVEVELILQEPRKLNTIC